MRKVRLKYPIQEIGGILYEVNLNRSHEEEDAVIVTKPPHHPSGKPSEAQKTQRQRFALAVAYAREALADPQLCAQYEAIAQQQGKRPWGVAFSDSMQGNNLLSKD
jgi:hypothetical protein